MDKKYYAGKQFVIKVENNSSENDFIQSALLNGQKIEGPRILHADIVKGGELIIELGDVPNKGYW